MKTMLATLTVLFVGITGALADEIILITPETVKWGPAPAVLPAGAEIAVLHGDMSKNELWTARLKLPAGYVINPHYHAGLEAVTVISGEFALASGSVFERSKLVSLKEGSLFVMSPMHQHFAEAVTETVIQISSCQPFTMEYVDPKHDPRIKP